MSAEEKRHVDREMARGLCNALEPVIAGKRDPLAIEAARNVAQLLVLPGLERLLAVLGTHAGAQMPAELRHAVDRLRRERDRALAQSSLLTFYESDREIGAFAAHLEGLDWREAREAEAEDAPMRAPREAVIGLMQALGGGRYAGEASETAAARTRLGAPAAAVLRAALDWLLGPGGTQTALRVSEDSGTAEIECRGVDTGGLLPAHEVIAAVGGCLFPAQNGDPGAWVIRLPAAAARESFLMLQQDDLHLALPWTHVLRIQLETAEDEPLVAPPLAPLKPLTGARRGRPVVTVGHGLRRGSLAVDRLVWRLAAEPAETGEAPPAGTTRAVRTDDGEMFWVIDVAKLMRDVPLPPLPEARTVERAQPARADAPAAPAPPARAETVPAEPPATTTPAERPAEPPAPPRTMASTAPPSPAAPSEARAERPKLTLLRPEQVEPLEDGSAPGDAVEVDAPAPPAPQPAAPADVAANPPVRRTSPRPGAGAGATAAAGHGRRALIAEDSFMARVFLMRLLQTQGYDVHAVGSAQEMRATLAGEVWALVCVDVDLPDARGAAWVREVLESQSDQPEPAVVVALVRDGRDAAEAASGGVTRTLLKPFAQRDVAALLERAGLPAAGPR